jgi:membrane protein DedA with SNARE-associated domain
MSGFEAELVATLGAEVARLQAVLERFGLWVLAVAALAEGFGIPLPGQTLLIACALLAAQGRPDILWVLLVAWGATWAGDLIGYWLGRRGLSGWLGRAAGGGGRLARVQALFARWGLGLLVVARFLDGLRQTSNIAAGALEMPWWRFLVGTAIGTSLWVGVFGLGVYALDSDRQAVLAGLHALRVWGWALVAVALAGLLVYLRRRRAG